MSGLLGTQAPPTADLVAMVEVLIAVMLIVGMFIVRRGHVRLHAYIQGSMVLVNIPIVLSWMVPSYLEYVLPDLPREFAKSAYWVPTIMLVAGVAAEVLGIYIVLVAATNWVPERFRFRRYKLVMRSELILWWSVVLTGLAYYYLIYVSPTAS